VNTPDRTGRSQPLGAYGIRLRGLEAAADLLVPVDAAVPAYDVDSRLVIDRQAQTASFQLSRVLRADEIVHPYLAPAAAVIGRWLGRESVHAGAVAVDGRALGVVGTREAGKSSTLAWLALSGSTVLCDDLLVIEHARALSGPRSIDLREDAAARLGAGEPIGLTGARERWRLTLSPAPPDPELVGFVFLAWGDRVEVRSLGAAERLARLAPQRGLRLEPTRPEAILELASRPAWEISRPRRWAALPEVGARLLELAATTPPAGA
jgi:hypothetical protein